MIDRIFSIRGRSGRFDLESLELMVRESVHSFGAIVLERVLEHEDASSLDRSCECGGMFKIRKRQSKTLVTVLGPIRINRARLRCDGCYRWRVQVDELLDVVKTGFSPGMRRMMSKTGAEVCFDKARDLIVELAGVKVSDKEVERFSEGIGEDIGKKEEVRIEEAMAGNSPKTDAFPTMLYIAMDGTGIPVLRKETKGRKGKSPDGIAHTREVKLGAVFTQTGKDEKGNPVRDNGSTSYVGKIESADQFGPRLYSEAMRRGLNNAGRVVVLGDGAVWIWNLADEHFPGATQIVDYYHAKEHLGDLSKILYPSDGLERKKWMDRMSGLLWESDVGELISALRSLRIRGEKKSEIDKTAGYFERNRKRMSYAEFRIKGLFIGSGVVEAACKTVIGKRLKQSGMHWSVRGANAIIALRCHIESRRFGGYWENRKTA